MFAIVKRVLDVAGSFSPASRRSLMWWHGVQRPEGVLHGRDALGAVWWALENRDHLGADVALQCLGILLASVAGQCVFQYLVDIKMDARGLPHLPRPAPARGRSAEGRAPWATSPSSACRPSPRRSPRRCTSWRSS